MTVTPRTISQATHAPPPVAASGGAPPGGPPGTGFDLLLAMEAQARTAPAEGRDTKTDTTNGAVTEQDAPQGTETRDAGEQPAPAPAPAPDVPATPEVPAQATVDVSTAPTDDTSTTTGDAPASPAVPALEGAETAPQQGVEAPAAAEAGTSPMPEATVPALEGAGAVAGPAGSETAVEAAASEPETAPAASAGAPTAPTAAADEAAPEPDAPEAAKPAAERPAPAQAEGPAGRGQGHAFGRQEDHRGRGGDGQQPAAATTPAAEHAQAWHAAPAASPPPVQAASPAGVPAGPLLAPQVQRIEALVQVAVRRGAASANLELHPAELGKVQVRLRTVAGGGLTATMTVDRPDALQALQAAADQLRRSLEDQGVQVVRLEIGLSAQARGDEARTGARSDGRDASGDRRSGGTDAATDPDHDDALMTSGQAGPLVPGALVDVRA